MNCPDPGWCLSVQIQYVREHAGVPESFLHRDAVVDW
jgi:hypothetical protein